MKLRKPGGSNKLQTANLYFGWNVANGAGRLKQITAGTVNDANSLLDLRYYTGSTPAYDSFGNLENIYRYDTNDALLETQTFGYDTLDRLTSAAADGSAGYSETYDYNTDTGNLSYKSSVGSYVYNAPRQGCSAGTNSTIPHAVMTAGANSYAYDCNGNMLNRPGQSLTFDAENRLVSVNSGATASFVYNGDGARVKSVIGSTTTVFVGEYLEWDVSSASMKKYYFAGGKRIALRQSSGALFWLIGDHLGSITVTPDANGGNPAWQLYKAWGEVRPGPGNGLATRYTFTGQADDGIGIMYYRARWVDNSLGRFISADTIVPPGGQGWDRYAYSRNSPVNFSDPSGHLSCKSKNVAEGDCSEGKTLKDYIEEFGVTLDETFKAWDGANLRALLTSMRNMDAAFRGHLRSLIEGATLRIDEYTPSAECPLCRYGGRIDGQTLTFYTIGSEAIRQMNIFHEFGHLIDNRPGKQSEFSNQVDALQDPSFIGDNGYVSGLALKSQRVPDANYPLRGAQAIQASDNNSYEQWADVFTNYVAGNINMSTQQGSDMYDFALRALSPYIYRP